MLVRSKIGVPRFGYIIGQKKDKETKFEEII